MPPRPDLLPPGTPVGSRYVIEGLVRRSEGRNFYIAAGPTDDGAVRRFLLSAHQDPAHFDAFIDFASLTLSHPGLLPPTETVLIDQTLFSIVPYSGEGLMIDEAAPLSNARLLSVGQRILGTLAYLHARGVCLATLTLANLLVSQDGTVRLFDLEVEEILDGPVPRARTAPVLRAVGEMLRRYCNVDSTELAELLLAAEEGAFGPLVELGREIERRFETCGQKTYAPLLGSMSDVGLVRSLNEDNWRWIRLSERAKLYVVADGMGGHDSGEVASALAVKTICEVARAREASAPQGEDAVENLLDESFRTANNTVKDAADERGIDMGTTMVCTLVVDPPTPAAARVGFIANVGDSRGYLLRGGVLHQITRDHSLVQKMVDRGRLTREEARNHAYSNILLRTVGTERDVEIDIFRVDLEPGDKVLMCSDGLWGEVEDRDMESILNTYEDPRVASRELVRAAHHGGGKDNVTLMIVTIP